MAFDPVVNSGGTPDTLPQGFDRVNANFALLSSVANGAGASLVNIEDSATYYNTNTVEGALQELGANTGAGIIGILDAGNHFGTNTVEGALGELGARWVALYSTIGATLVGISDAGTYYNATSIEGALQELGATTGAGIIGIVDSGGNFTSTNVEGALAELASGAAAVKGSLTGVASLNYGATASSNVALPTNSGSIRLHAITDCYINFGDSGVSASGVDGIPFLKGTELIGVPAGATHIAVKAMSTGATANITGLSEDYYRELGTTVQLDYATSDRITLPATSKNIIRLYNPTDCYVNFGDSTVTSSNTTGMFIEAGSEYIPVPSAATHIAISKYMLEGTAYITGVN